MDSFVKLYGSIIMSSVWEEPAHIKVVWITMLAMADQHGYVGASRKGLATMARVSLEQLDEALKCFLSPDPDSRSEEYEGRRAKKTDRGWHLLNYSRFREMRTSKQINTAERVAKHRKKNKVLQDVTGNNVTQSNTEYAQKQKQKQKKLNNIPAPLRSQVSEWEKISKEFLDSTCLNRKAPPSPKVWARQLKQFANREDIQFPRIKKVLGWYSRQFDKEVDP